jgi:hypothetical protein
MFIAAGAACATFAVAPAVRAEMSSETHTSNGAARVTRETATVVAIDPRERVVMLQDERGQTNAIDVPPDVKMFDKLKVGDRIDVDYYEGLALSLLPPGTKPTRTERETRSTTGTGAANIGNEVNVSAEIISVDPSQDTVTFKGPRGVRTVRVNDPQLQRTVMSLKPGQVVQLTYRRATAASIRPSAH